jgi:hypothetical protein
MFSSNEEFYQYIDLLIAKLNASGEPEWGAALKDAKVSGSTGGEVLGNILLALKKFQASKIPRKLGMQGEIRAITMDLGRVLKRWN